MDTDIQKLLELWEAVESSKPGRRQDKAIEDARTFWRETVVFRRFSNDAAAARQLALGEGVERHVLDDLAVMTRTGPKPNRPTSRGPINPWTGRPSEGR